MKYLDALDQLAIGRNLVDLVLSSAGADKAIAAGANCALEHLERAEVLFNEAKEEIKQ